MNKSNSQNIARERVDHLVSTFSKFRILIIAPIVICTVLALAYSILKTNTWTARQSLVIRDDLTGDSFKPGRFESLESLKLAQETILEIAREPQVIRNAMQKLGPPPFMVTGKKNWPNEKVIEQTQGQITFAAPNGAEFGKTEVFLLNAKGSTRERARQFIDYMLDEIDQKLSEVRTLKVQSMVTELQQAVDTAQASFDESAKQLQEMDAEFGADLSTLRSLNLQQTGNGSLEQTIVEIRKEQRTAAQEVELALRQRQLLVNALEEPQQYLVTSSELLKMQPRLNQLVEGLSKAELQLADLRGKYTDQHAQVLSSKVGIRDIKLRILKEIQASIHGLSSQIDIAQARLDSLKHYEKEFENRLSSLSSSRVAYDKLEQEVGKKSEVLGQARQDLAQIQSLGASTANLLTRVGDPQVSTRPDGPGKRAIVGAGVLCGLLIGFGLLMFVAPPFDPHLTSSENLISNEHGELPRETRASRVEPAFNAHEKPQTIEETVPPSSIEEPPADSIVSTMIPEVPSKADKARSNVQAIMASIKDSIGQQMGVTTSSLSTETEESTVSVIDRPVLVQDDPIDEQEVEVEGLNPVDEADPIDLAELPTSGNTSSGNTSSDNTSSMVPDFTTPTASPVFEVLEIEEGSNPFAASNFESELVSPNENSDSTAEAVVTSESSEFGDSSVQPFVESSSEAESSSDPEEVDDSAPSEKESVEPAFAGNKSPAITIDLSELQANRKENLRPIDLTRSANEEEAETVRVPEVTTPVSDFYLPRPEDNPAEDNPVSEHDENEDAEELSPEEIVRQIRAQQIAAAGKLNTEIPQTLDQQPKAEADTQLEKQEQVDRADIVDDNLSKTDNQEVGESENPDLAIEQNDESKDTPRALPIPDQIKQLSDSISTFCDPLKNTDPEPPAEQADF